MKLNAIKIFVLVVFIACTFQQCASDDEATPEQNEEQEQEEEELPRVNLALNKTVVVSSSDESTDFADTYAVDGDPATAWSSSNNSFKQNIYVDLTEVTEIDSVAIIWKDGYYTKVLDINVKNGESDNWTLAYTQGNEETPITNPEKFTVDGLNTSGRYVQFQFRGRPGTDRYRVAELEIYAPKAK